MNHRQVTFAPQGLPRGLPRCLRRRPTNACQNRGHSMRTRGWNPACLLMALGLLLPGCEPPGKPNPADRPLRPEQVTRFATLYGARCAGCHGAEGLLGAAPPLNDPLFRAAVSEQELSDVIRSGRKGGLMPGFGIGHGALTDAQVQLLIYEIKGVPYRVHSQMNETAGPKHISIEVATDGQRPQWGHVEARPSDMPPLAPSAAELGDANRGKAVFARACAGCHGEQGQGKETADGPGAINDRAFLALMSDRALRRLVITGRPDLGMPDYAGKAGRSDDFTPLTSAEVADLVALLALWRTTGEAAQP